MITWRIETRKISSLKPNEKNPRRLSQEDADQLQKSLDKFGLVDKPIVNANGGIIGGHQRVSLLKRNKVKEVDCWVPDRLLDPKEVDEFCIRLNRNHGEFDFDKLANEFETSDLIDWGFKAEEFLGEVETIEPEAEDDETLSPPKNPKTKLGDIYDLDGHRIVCGDSTAPDCVHKCLQGKEPILMVTDPPYGVEYDAAWREGIHGKKGKGARAKGKVQNDDQINWSLAWHLFPGNIAYVWHAGKYCSEVQKSLQEAEFEIISQIIWVKQHFVLSRGDYHWKHEPCWYAVRKGRDHNWQGSRDQSTVWEVANLNPFGKNTDDERTCHSTQKPIECMSIPIKNNTAPSEYVYDPFLGSGTTLIACEQLDRKCFGIELDPAYCDVIVDRWIKYRLKQGKEAKIIKNDKELKDFYGSDT